MCGIVGYRSSSRQLDGRALEAMTATLEHRGPDDCGVWLSEDGLTGLGHRRLSIIDLSGAARQPMTDRTGRYRITYNGEIYNFRELRDELASSGWRFSSQSDTEVVLAAYARWGARSLDRLRGMFAFVIWDAADERLFAARDRLGIKPLSYFWNGSTLIVSSEARAILRHPLVRRDVVPSAVRDFLTYGFVPDPRSIFSNVAKLPPGHTLTLLRGRLEVARWWDVALPSGEDPAEEVLCDEVLSVLDDAVRSHLVADVPVGVFLSGGVDSSAVASGLAASRGPLPKAFTVGFEEAAYDELPHARRVAQHLGIDLVEDVVTAETLDANLDMVAEVYDEPFGDPSAVPTYALARSARQHVTVALSGDGGDECFGGYGTFARVAQRTHDSNARAGAGWWAAKTLVPPVARRRLAPYHDRVAWWSPSALRGLGETRAVRTLARWQHHIAVDPVELYMRAEGHWMPEETARLVPDADRGEDPFWAFRSALEPGLGSVEQALRLSLKVVLPGRMLTKVDRASMAHGLEVRVPLLDHAMVELAARIPSRWKVGGGERKVLLKRALERRLPHDALYRRKQGFTPPYRTWLRDPDTMRWVSSSILANAVLGDLTNRRYVRRFLDVCRHRDLGRQLWDLVVLDRWTRRWAA